MRFRVALLCLSALLVVSGCWSAAEPSLDSTVVINNTSTLTLTDVHVTTAPGDELTDASIAAGATTRARAVHAVYGTIHVTARVGNQPVSVIPIEGFAGGFNTRLPDGTYTVVLVVHTEPDGVHWLEASVTPGAP
jgi:hypothetical protein